MATQIDFHKFLQVIVLIGPGGATDGGGWGWNGKKIVKIPPNNPELRRLAASAGALHAVENAANDTHLAELGRVAEAAMSEAAKDIGQRLQGAN